MGQCEIKLDLKWLIHGFSDFVFNFPHLEFYAKSSVENQSEKYSGKFSSQGVKVLPDFQGNIAISVIIFVV